MRFKIEANPPGPLRVVKEIPSERLAMLEGLNGIGKTLTVRVLQLCTGDMPYRIDSPAWRSLCEGLGSFSVTAKDLIGADEILWEAVSSEWLDDTPFEGPVKFRRLLINDVPATVDDVQRILRVHRLAGDEDIVETLAKRADFAADSVTRWGRRHASVDYGPLAALEGRLSEVSELLGDWSVERYDDVRSAVVDARSTVSYLTTDAQSLRARRDALQEARRIQHQLQQFESDMPSLRVEVANVDDEIEAVRGERDRMYDAITSLAGQVAAAAPVARELHNARRTLERNRDKLATALDALAVAASEAAVEASGQEIRRALQDTESVLVELSQNQATLDQAPAMRDVLDASTGILERAENQGLSSQILIDDAETDTQLTVAETRTGMQSRRTQLEGQPPPPEAEEIAAMLSAATLRRDLLRVANSRAEDVSRFRRLVNESHQRVEPRAGRIRSDGSRAPPRNGVTASSK